MPERFADPETRLIAEGLQTKATRRLLPSNLHPKAVRLIDYVLRARLPQACAIFSGFKMLHGPLRGTYQLDVGKAHRLRFEWHEDRAVNISVGEFHDED